MKRATELAIIKEAMRWYRWKNVAPFNVIAKNKLYSSGGPLFRACARAEREKERK